MASATFSRLAQLVRAKHNEGDRPYVLFLGTAAPLSSGCSTFSDIVKDIAECDDPAAFFDFLDSCAPDERVPLLKKHLEGSSPSPGYHYLAELVKAGYFDVILTTNVDSLLETSLTDAGLHPSRDYVCLINGLGQDAQIVRLMKQLRPRTKVLKLHGDLGLGILTITPAKTFQFSSQVSDILREHLNRGMLIVGYGPWDSNDVNRCIELSTQSVWYVAPDKPDSDSFIYHALVARRATRNIISGEEGQFDRFFKVLRDALIQPEPAPPPTLAQEIEQRGSFASDEAVHLAIELCRELVRDHEAGVAHTLLQSESVLYIGGDSPTVQIVETATAPAQGGQDAERASDALGVGQILYQMLTGAAPGDSPSPPSSANPNVCSALDRLVLRSLTTDAFSTPEALQQHLEIYRDGKWLPEILEREGRFHIKECIWQAIRLCNQLERHHDKGLSHHNLTSDNVMLADVGDKRHACWIETAVLSTEDEIAESEAAEDVCAVGAILYEMLTGRPLPDSDESTLFSGASSWIRLGSDRIVLKALASEPTERYRDVVILRERLYHHLSRLQQAEEIDTLIRASYPIVYIVSWEENRVAALLRQIAEIGERPFYSWTASRGLLDVDGRRPRGQELTGPTAVLDHILNSKEEALYVLFDFHPFLRRARQSLYDLVCRRLRDLAAQLRHSRKALVIVAPVLEVPPECEKDITVMHFGLPTPGEIADVLDDIITLIQSSGGKVELGHEDYEKLIQSATGLTLTAAERAFTLASMLNSGVLNHDAIEIVLREKEHALYRSGALEIFSSPEDFGDIGGLEVLKEWAAKRAQAFTIEAQDFGLPAPKGVLLIGVPGCGKSLAAKAIASEWKKPLLRLDAGALFSARVGSSEENLRNALQVAEAIAPSILWIDEIEKSFSGIHTIDDGGVTARVLGGLITWLQEKTVPVFVVATANSIGDPSPSGQGYARSGGLPPELLRKGRFDELFFVDLPDHEERKQIFEIHLGKRGHDPSALDLDELATASEGYSGAEIEQAVLSAMYEAFDGLNRLYKLVQPDLERLNEEAASALQDLSEAELEEGWRALLLEAFNEGTSTGQRLPAAEPLKNLFEHFLTEWPVERLLEALITSERSDEEPTMGLNQQAILRGLGQIYPLSTMMRTQIEALRQWAKDNARSASHAPERVPGQRLEEPGVSIGPREEGD